MAENDALTKPLRSRRETALDTAVTALLRIDRLLNGASMSDANALFAGDIARGALGRISTLRKEAGE